MFVAFSKTARSLKAEDSYVWLFTVFFVALILASWAAWLLLGRVTIYAVSNAARLEAAQAVHPVQSLYAGRITASHLGLGRAVKQGDVLIELDANVQRLQLLEERMERKPLDAELQVLKREIESEERAMEEQQRAAEIGVEEARARLREAEAEAAYADLEVDRKSDLHEAGLISQLELARVTTQAKKQHATVDSLKLTVERQEREQLAQRNERQSHIESLRRDVNRLSGQGAKVDAVLNRLESEVGLRRILAPTDGIIGEVADLKIGAVVSPGERLGAIIPAGDLKIVARFDPAETLGRIRKSQPARLRLAGFPWTQYGTLKATVTSVAEEVRDGSIRVELKPESDFRFQLQHGLPGTIEVEIERISPASLLLRLAGRMLSSKQPPLVANDSADRMPQRQSQ